MRPGTPLRARVRSDPRLNESDRRTGSDARRDQGSAALEATVVAAAFALLGLGYVIYGARSWAPPLASQHGVGIDRMLAFLLSATGLMFLAGHLALAWLIWTASRRGSVTLRMATQKTERRLSVALGLLMTLVAEGGVLVIAMPVWDVYFMSDAPDNAVQLEITGQQFVWTARYPGPDGVFGRTDPHLIEDPNNSIGLDRSEPAAADDIMSTNQITVPVGRPVSIMLRSRDMIHSFWLPHFRVKQDVVPGMSIPVWFVPTREGTFEIACTELCGLGHYRMQGYFHVVSAAEFERWLAERATG